MEIYISIPENIYKSFIQHLLPKGMKDEEALFVFADAIKEGEKLTFVYRDYIIPEEKDFDYKSAWHIELSDDFRARLIKKAHNLKASVIEFHSHIKQKKAKFSASDWNGFRSFVPHLFWRLQKRPYAAVVVTQGSFDALAWVKDGISPQPLVELVCDNKRLKPTKLSVKEYKDE